MVYQYKNLGAHKHTHTHISHVWGGQLSYQGLAELKIN